MSSTPGFYQIPQETLDQILDYLEEDAPCPGKDAYLRKQPCLPSAQDVRQGIQQQGAVHLKSLSLVSRRLRAAVLDRLFLRLQLVIYHPPPVSTQQHPSQNGLFDWTTELSEIAAFIRSKDLGKTAKYFVLKIVDGQGHYLMDFREELQKDLTEESISIGQHWHQFLDEVPLLERLTIIAPPFCLGVVISVPLDPWISEAIHMPYHVLSLVRNIGSLSGSARPLIGVSKVQDDSNSKLSLLTASDWTSVLLNEGSFVRWHTHWVSGWEDDLLSASRNVKLPEAFCVKIKSFEYIGVLPPTLSFRRLTSTLKAMPALCSFSFQVEPMDDLFYDLCPPENASFQELRDTVLLDYQIVFDEMIARPASGSTAKAVNSFRELVHIQCLDQGSDSRELWKYATAGTEMMKWRRDKNGRSLRKRDL